MAEDHKLLIPTDRPLKAAIEDAFDDILEEARRQTALSLESPDTAVHQWRKTVRRARSLIRLIRPALPKGVYVALQHHLRSAFALTHALRDNTVLKTVSKILKTEDRSLAAAFKALPVDQYPLPPAFEALHQAWTQLEHLPPLLHQALPPLTLKTLKTGLKQTYRAAVLARHQTALHFLPPGPFHPLSQPQPGEALVWLHTWRKRTKTLRYQLEALCEGRDLPPTHPRALLLHACAEVASQLGEITDLNMALQRVPVEQSALRAGIDHLIHQRTHAIYLASTPVFDLSSKNRIRNLLL